ncbi:MAG: lactonase family protein [Candidatus Latescibacteria bacterium]|jgi:6-phosphogluconolactonase|nr:lactonase family protein [Candidatus Latescibacterota bacterium]
MALYLYLSVTGENRIARYSVDLETGYLQLKENTALESGPAPLAVDPQQRFLYAGLRSTREVLSFEIDQDNGSLRQFASVTIDSDPCCLSTDNTGRFLFSAHYGGGLIGVHPIGQDGAVHGPPVEWRETQQFAHYTQTDASNQFVFLPHVSDSNVIYQFRFDESTGKLTPNDPPTVSQPLGTGPRHYVHHPSLKVVYVDNEQGCSVTAYHFDSEKGTLAPFQTLSTLPEGWQGENTCAQIHIDPTGRFLYASNRGHESIACYRIDQSTGELESVGQAPTEPMPRAFNIDPEGRYLFAGGLESDNMASYSINQETGALDRLETYNVGKSPMWIHLMHIGS